MSPTGCHSGCHEAPHKRPHQSFHVSKWTDSTGPCQTQKPSEPKGLHAGMIMANPGVLEPERVPCKSLLRIDFQITNLDRKPSGFNGRADLFFHVQSAPPCPLMQSWAVCFRRHTETNKLKSAPDICIQLCMRGRGAVWTWKNK